MLTFLLHVDVLNDGVCLLGRTEILVLLCQLLIWEDNIPLWVDSF